MKEDRSPPQIQPQDTSSAGSPCTYLRMLGSQLVQYVGGIKASVVTELAGNDLKGFSISTYQQLLLAWNGPGIVTEVFGELHLYGTATSDNRVVLEEKRETGHAHSLFQEGGEQESSFPKSLQHAGLMHIHQAQGNPSCPGRCHPCWEHLPALLGASEIG